jgi:deoxyribose-phosphate aldolase
MDEVAASSTSGPQLTYEHIAGMIEHAMLRPELSAGDVHTGCEIARYYQVAAVCVRPSDVDLVLRWMEGSGIPVSSTVSFPHGAATTPVKIFETRDLLVRGVKEVDTVLNIGKMISGEFSYVEAELQQMARICHEGGAILKVSFENSYLTGDMKAIACKICTSAGVDYARTCTSFSPEPFSLDDIRLMRRLCGPSVKVKASGGVRTLGDVLAVREAGGSRVGTLATVTILESWKIELAGRHAGVSM